MQNNEPFIYLITGIMASGKSTVAQRLADRISPSVHLRGDLFRKMIVNDRKEMRPGAAAPELEQLRLRYRLTVQAAETYAEAGLNVIVQDVIVGPMLNEFISLVRKRPLYVAVLCPRAQVVEQREAARAKKGYGHWTVDGLDRLLREETPRLGLWLDSSDMTPEETTSALWHRRDEARIIS